MAGWRKFMYFSLERLLLYTLRINQPIDWPIFFYILQLKGLNDYSKVSSLMMTAIWFSLAIHHLAGEIQDSQTHQYAA